MRVNYVCVQWSWVRFTAFIALCAGSALVCALSRHMISRQHLVLLLWFVMGWQGCSLFVNGVVAGCHVKALAIAARCDVGLVKVAEAAWKGLYQNSE